MLPGFDNECVDSPKQSKANSHTQNFSDGIYNVKWDVTGVALKALGQQISHPLLGLTQTEQRRHGTAWDSDQYQGPGL